MKKVPMTAPIAEICGDEMAHVLWTDVKEMLLLPFVNLKTVSVPRDDSAALTPFAAAVQCSAAGHEIDRGLTPLPVEGVPDVTDTQAAVANADDTAVFQTVHGSLPKHFAQYLKGEPTDANPIATVLVWSNALRANAEVTENEELSQFCDDLESALLTVLGEDIRTADLADDDTDEIVSAREFLAYMRSELEDIYEDDEPVILSITDEDGTANDMEIVWEAVIGDDRFAVLVSTDEDNDDLLILQVVTDEDGDDNYVTPARWAVDVVYELFMENFEDAE
ncbi:MAG: isocitrate/isopropylmalate family dehydrogenase [Clostridia bacterium]|nr:isocitrate/isopropylmalate family dehydrogenase [Clostridia bacterium]